MAAGDEASLREMSRLRRREHRKFPSSYVVEFVNLVMDKPKAKKLKGIMSFFNLKTPPSTSSQQETSNVDEVIPDIIPLVTPNVGSNNTLNVHIPFQSQRVEVDLDSLERDPFKRIPIRAHPTCQKDEIRRAYIRFGAFQPRLKEYKATFDGNQKRRFQKSWYDQFPWLEYSPTNDCTYCFPCFLFDYENNSHNAFTSTGFNSWKRVNNGKQCSLLKHVGDVNSQHNRALLFVDSLMNPSQHIDKVMNQVRPEQIKRNRLRIMTTIKSVVYLTLQACALRGHDESIASKNRGNLIELIKLFGEMSIEIKDITLENAPGNASYTSHVIQKDILSIVGNRVRKSIRQEIGNSYYCILVDESRDCSNKEQMAIVVRFVDSSGLVKERFVDIVRVRDTCAKTLKKEILDVLSRNNLQISKMRGQGYDGASNMSGAWNGLQALFLRDCPYAYHVHCFAHRLQLALVTCAGKVRPVYCFVSNLNKIVNIVSASPKRHTDLQSAQAIEIAKEVATGERKTGKGANQMGNLHRPGQTRWSSHFDSTCSLIDMFGAVISVLGYMSDESSNYETGGEAYGCKMVMRSFDFVFMLHLMNKVLGLSDLLCRSLQQKSLDILNAMDLVSTTKGFLQQLRDDGLDCLLTHVESVCRQHNIPIPNMDDCYEMGTGRSCQQTDFITVGHHYRVDIFNNVIDTQLAEINSRFNDETVELFKLSASLDPKDNFRLFDEDHIYDLADKFYPDDFSDQEMHRLRNELNHFKVDVHAHPSFQNLSTISELSQKLVETGKSKIYEMITRLIHLVMTLPVTTATTERAFSAMKLVKSVLRNKMEKGYLSNSLVMYIEREFCEDIDVDSVIDEFYEMKNRRISFK